MSFLNNDYSLSYSIEQPAQSAESQVEFLKLKLLQTHSKLLQQLEYSKQIQEHLHQANRKLQSSAREQEDITKRMASITSKHERNHTDKLKQLQLSLLQSQKKNDLLRNDLESMRHKTLQLVAANQHLQQQLAEQTRSQHKLNERLNSLTKQQKLRDIAYEQARVEAERFRSKYEKQVSNNQEAEAELQDLKRERGQLSHRNDQIQNALRTEKEKQSKHINQILSLQKEAKQWKTKAEGLSEEIAKIKQQTYQLKARTKGEERNLVLELERLTQDYNNLQLILKQRDSQLQSARLKQIEFHSRKKSTFEQTKELVDKLERQQHKVGRTTPNRIDKPSPRQPKHKTYKQQKQDYLSMIENVGSMQSQLLACNLQKKKLLAEMDKIDQTRVKTKDMIARRRRLEVELQNQERKLDHVRAELKKMKVM